MGLFLQLSGLANRTWPEVEKELRRYVSNEKGVFKQRQNTSLDSDSLIVKESNNEKISLLYFGDFLRWQSISAYLSQVLKAPVIMLHIHDGDFWIYELFNNGQVVDRYNPLPDYWDDDLSDKGRDVWKGNAVTLCKYWPGVNVSKLEKYLVPWNNIEGKSRRRSNFGDIFTIGDEWQMLDFMWALGLIYPISFPFDISGEAIGRSYRMSFSTK